jgi:nitrile hydratase accessory protein
MYERNRNIVHRHADGRPVNVARPRGQLFVCSSGCCCGRTAEGFPAVPAELYHTEWERRRLRNVVHLTIGGCLGPCALANVALLLFDGQAFWFHSINSDDLVRALYDYAEQMLDADRVLPPPVTLADHQFTASAWQARPDGQPVDDVRTRRGRGLMVGGRREEVARVSACEAAGGLPLDGSEPEGYCEAPEADRLVADMGGVAAAPRKNGELVFEAPWQGRAFGMAVALNEQQVYPWDNFRERLIEQIAAAEARGDGSSYYEHWLSAFESLLAAEGVVTKDEIDERTYEFEFGERDDVF